MSKRLSLMDVISSRDFVILDTETTGLSETSEIVSIAIIAANGQPLLNKLVKPARPIPPDATRIHGITNEMVKDADPFPCSLIHQMLMDQQVIIYNKEYDLSMLYRSNKAAGLPFVEWVDVAAGWHCAMNHFSEIYGEWNDYRQNYRWQKLTTAAAYYKISTEGAHGALADCQMTLEVCKAMLNSQISSHAD